MRYETTNSYRGDRPQTLWEILGGRESDQLAGRRKIADLSNFDGPRIASLLNLADADGDKEDARCLTPAELKNLIENAKRARKQKLRDDQSQPAARMPSDED